MMSVFIIILINKENSLVENGSRAFTFIYIGVWEAQDVNLILTQRDSFL